MNKNKINTVIGIVFTLFVSGVFASPSTVTGDISKYQEYVDSMPDYAVTTDFKKYFRILQNPLRIINITNQCRVAHYLITDSAGGYQYHEYRVESRQVVPMLKVDPPRGGGWVKQEYLYSEVC
ncbi:hypothetical protein [Spartinivicinus poritis]|uniref:Uncharacterized protein n=1 Tax=Spartinivicinus poritis TaxID=2994640 RepID=A0ABT5UAB2_9GAMM|nr:hypothetical protein [Spartinivicinus sp. A2-2]MDE1462074.1 hypothetical protein [Spartinivicinus sp. A2-2]